MDHAGIHNAGRLTNRGAARRTLCRLISRESDDNPDVHAATFYLSGGGGRTNFKAVLTLVFGAVVVSKTACVSFHPKVWTALISSPPAALVGENQNEKARAGGGKGGSVLAGRSLPTRQTTTSTEQNKSRIKAVFMCDVRRHLVVADEACCSNGSTQSAHIPPT